jgi:hypothetical protein
MCLISLVLPAVLAAAMVTPAAAQFMYQLKAADIDAVVIEGSSIAARGKLAIFQEFKPSLMFYARQPIDSFFAPGQLVPDTTAAAEVNPQYVIVSDKSLSFLKTMNSDCFKLVFKKGNWGLYRAQGLKLVHLPRLESTFQQGLNLSVGSYHWGTLPFAGGGD